MGRGFDWSGARAREIVRERGGDPLKPSVVTNWSELERIRRERAIAKKIEAGRTARGGFTKAQLAVWGVPWPPPKGWKRRLERGEPVTDGLAELLAS